LPRQVVVGFTASIAAGTAIDISRYVPAPVHRIIKALRHFSGTTTANSTTDELSVVTVAPATGQIQLSGPKEIKLGDAVNPTYVLVLSVQLKTDYHTP